MALSKAEIGAVVQELTPVLSGGWVQKVSQPAPHLVILDVRARGQTVSVLFSADPEHARVHAARQRLVNPPSPPPFCQFLRAQLLGSRVESVEQVNEDRIVQVRFVTRQGPRVLLASMTGRSADLLLLDAEGTILTSLRTGSTSRGKRYVRPVQPVERNAQPRPDRPVERDEGARFPVSEAVERRYGQREEEAGRRRAIEARLGALRRAIKKARRRVEVLRGDLDRAARYQGYARYGELLKANLGDLAKGQEHAVVTDYYDPAMPELVIPLDPAKGPQANMEDYFRKHRKYLTAEREIRPRLAEVEGELAALVQEEVAVREERLPPVKAVSPEARRARTKAGSPKEAGRTRPPRSGPFRRFTSSDGLPIYVGRNARENEALTHRFARGEDLWLHARGVPGSHVVVRLEKGVAPPPETLREAATLALLYSDLKKSGKGEVIYTRKKWVRKAKGGSPGTVSVTQERSLFVTLDKGRLSMLKARSG